MTSSSPETIIDQLNSRMAEISSSHTPEDVAALAYIWGFSLVTMQRQFNFVTSPNVPPGGIGRGPANKISCSRNLIDASFTDVPSPNVDTLYCQTQFDLTEGPVVLVVPPIIGRYYTFQFIDAYTNVFAYIGTRATGSSGGTFLIAGPDWDGPIQEGMMKIWSPTNLAWLVNRILVKGLSDVANVNAIQDKIIVKPLSAFHENDVQKHPTSEAPANAANVTSSSSAQLPVGPQPALIPATGIKIYDEICQAMIGNPLNPPDPVLVTKLASIGIGPGKTPSTQANDSTKKALHAGITEAQKMIDTKVANIGTVVNGWLYAPQAGVYGTDYLFRAAATQLGLGANVAQEALYPVTFTDNEGKPLTGANSYTIHFDPGQIPPVKAFWSITMYNRQYLLVDNPINRYAINSYTDGLKYKGDDSLDIYIQHTAPGKDKESNWLPADRSSFSLVLRMYLPREEVLNGTWMPPLVQRIPI
ncbi:MAG TPA: DUF1254 domain-containing protein [Nitrososphaeraceae archaeon]|nr:DUF1254 domain-containing protein [Nitrososphaeraceae archaeon]